MASLIVANHLTLEQTTASKGSSDRPVYSYLIVCAGEILAIM